MTAFAPSVFLGTASKPKFAIQHAPAARTSGVRMVLGSRSVFWKGVANKGNTAFTASGARVGVRFDARKAMLSFELHKVDDYIAECARKQYIAASNPSGVYSPQCTEGGAKFATEEARVASLAAKYRAGMVDKITGFADIYETRRRALVHAQGCNFEENLINKFGGSAASAVVMGSSEKSRACARYATPNGVAEKYMTECVSRAAYARAAAGGLYGVMCCDGTTKDAAEAKRVSALAVAYRNGHRSLLDKEDSKREQARFACESYAHLCSYEEELFNKFPATGAAMRPDSARY